MTSHVITELVLQTEAILRLAVAKDGKPIKSADVAQATGLDGGSARRELRRMAEAGLLSIDGEGARGVLYYIPTGAAHDAIEALDRAAQAGPATGFPVAPHDTFRRNPKQPRKRFPDEMIADRAEGIVQVGGLLYPLIVDPADASGARMIQDGECRWRAIGLLIEQGRLPDGLKGGVPYTEKAGGEAQMLKTALIANAQRSDLTPWEDAQGLKRLKDLLGLSARGLALELGRAQEGSERGVADVQQKIKTAEQASAEDIALHESGERSWEWLRESVREARTLTSPARLAMIELKRKMHQDPVTGDLPHGALWALRSTDETALSFRELHHAQLIEPLVVPVGGAPRAVVRITDQGLRWFEKFTAGRDGAELLSIEKSLWIETLNIEQPGAMIDDEGYRTPWLNARRAKFLVTGEVVGGELPDQVDLEEAIAATQPALSADPATDEDPGPWRQGDDHEAWVRKRLRHALGSIKPRDLLAVVELADACHFKPYGPSNPGYTRTWAYNSHGSSKPQSLVAEYGCGGTSGGGTPELSHVHPATLEWLKDNGLFKPEGGGARSAMLYRVRQGVSQGGADLCERTGRYHTSWLNPPETAVDRATAPEPAKRLDLTDKQILLLAELADFRWRFSGGEHLPAGPHGGAHGLDKTLPALVSLVGPGGREGFHLSQAGALALKQYGLHDLTNIDSGVVDRNPGGTSVRKLLLLRAREAVINPTRAADMVDGEYVTPWLNTDTAQRVAAKVREKAAEKDRIAAFGTIVDEVVNGLTSRVHGVVGLAASKRDWAGEPAVDPREIPELADLVVSEFMGGNPFVACAHLAMIQLKVAKANLIPTAADAAITSAVARWRSDQAQESKALFTLKAGDVVNTGGATDYRLISRKDRQDSRVFDFVVQPILNGKDYGGERALNLSEIQRLAGANELSPQSIRLTHDAEREAAEATVEAPPTPAGPDDPDRDATSEDEYRGWIAAELIAKQQVDPANAAGFAARVFAANCVKFGETSGTWTRGMAAFDADDWAGDHLFLGQLKEPEPDDQSQTEGEQADAAA